MNLPGFHAESSLGRMEVFAVGSARDLPEAFASNSVIPALSEGCHCLQQSGVGPRLLVCCTTICKFGFGCVLSCWVEGTCIVAVGGGGNGGVLTV
jgi:hypothetical protein